LKRLLRAVEAGGERPGAAVGGGESACELCVAGGEAAQSCRELRIAGGELAKSACEL